MKLTTEKEKKEFEKAVKAVKEASIPKKCNFILDRRLHNTIKDKKMIKSILEGNTTRQAMRDAGYKGATLTHQSRKIRELAPTIIALMDKAGLSDEFMVKKLKSGFEADRPVVVDKAINDYPDHPTRHKYLETGLKLRNHLKDKIDVDVTFDFADRLHQARMNARMEAGLIPSEATG
jgi:hypothetical protein